MSPAESSDHSPRAVRFNTFPTTKDNRFATNCQRPRRWGRTDARAAGRLPPIPESTRIGFPGPPRPLRLAPFLIWCDSIWPYISGQTDSLRTRFHRGQQFIAALAGFPRCFLAEQAGLRRSVVAGPGNGGLGVSANCFGRGTHLPRGRWESGPSPTSCRWIAREHRR